MTIVNAVAIHPRSGEVWEELQKQLKKAIQIVKKPGHRELPPLPICPSRLCQKQ